MANCLCCEQPIDESGAKQRRYCSTRCRKKNANAREEAARAAAGILCTEADCARHAHIKGLCSLHYKRTRPRTPDKPKTVACVVCGTTVTRTPDRRRTFGATCSNDCRRILTFGDRCEIPADHPARWYGATCAWTPPKPEPATFQCGACDDCGTLIVEAAGQTRSAYCTYRCKKRVSKRRRRARECNALGEFTYSDVMRQYIRQGNVCAYCKQPVDGLPDPEHVIPLSRGGRNGMTNIVAACRRCNSEKTDHTLTEWAAARAERGQAPVDTALTDACFSHLVLDTPTPRRRTFLAA